jgi:carboxyl-terminal processing protease
VKDFDDGSAVRLTVARYYTPTGRSIQKPYLKGMKNILMSQKSVLRVVNYMRKTAYKVADSLSSKHLRENCLWWRWYCSRYFVPLEVEHGNENTVYEIRCGKFCFRAIRQK